MASYEPLASCITEDFGLMEITYYPGHFLPKCGMSTVGYTDYFRWYMDRVK